MNENKLKEIIALTKKGNNLGEQVILVGATKTVDAQTINKAVDLGLEVVAENRVQEFNQKYEFVKGAKWHFIGHLQTNKVKYLVGKVDLIHSVDSVHLAEVISQTAVKKGVTQNILIEVNVGGELSKSGVTVQNALQVIKEIALLPNLSVLGLMAMLPKSQDQNYLAELCLTMRSLFDKIKEQGYPLTYLSMGMSGDYEVAIQNGSNMIRLGRTIFGERM